MTQTNPLNWQTPIVDKNGCPTPEFMRQWATQQDANASIPALAKVYVNTSAPLSGGGSLVNGVLTLALAVAALIAAFTGANVSALLDIIGATRGSLLYRGASGWAILAPGAAGTVLTSQGTGADPHWV
jgi:hypothetical protein